MSHWMTFHVEWQLVPQTQTDVDTDDVCIWNLRETNDSDSQNECCMQNLIKWQYFIINSATNLMKIRVNSKFDDEIYIWMNTFLA